MAARPFRFRRLTAPLHASLGRTRSIYIGARVVINQGAVSALCLVSAAYTAWKSNKKGREMSELMREAEGKFLSADDSFWKTVAYGWLQDLVKAEKFSIVEALPEKYSQDPIFNEVFSKSC